jgi:hypothetical protein
MYTHHYSNLENPEKNLYVGFGYFLVIEMPDDDNDDNDEYDDNDDDDEYDDNDNDDKADNDDDNNDDDKEEDDDHNDDDNNNDNNDNNNNNNNNDDNDDEEDDGNADNDNDHDDEDIYLILNDITIAPERTICLKIRTYAIIFTNIITVTCVAIRYVISGCRIGLNLHLK